MDENTNTKPKRVRRPSIDRQLEAQNELIRILRPLSKEQRQSVLASAEAFLDTDKQV